MHTGAIWRGLRGLAGAWEHGALARQGRAIILVATTPSCVQERWPTKVPGALAVGGTGRGHAECTRLELMLSGGSLAVNWWRLHWGSVDDQY